MEGALSGALTIPLLRLFPGLPRGIFSSTCAFLGGILVFFAYERENVKAATSGSLVVLVAGESGETCPKAADLAARGEKARGREAKEERGEMRDDVVAIERLMPASVAHAVSHATPGEEGRSSLEIGVGRGIGQRCFFVGGWRERMMRGCRSATNFDAPHLPLMLLPGGFSRSERTDFIPVLPGQLT